MLINNQNIPAGFPRWWNSWYLADTCWQKDRYSSTVTTQGNKHRKFKAPLQQKGLASASTLWKSTRVERAAEPPAALALRRLLQSPKRSSGVPPPAWCTWVWAFRGSAVGHTQPAYLISKSLLGHTTLPFLPQGVKQGKPNSLLNAVLAVW